MLEYLKKAFKFLSHLDFLQLQPRDQDPAFWREEHLTRAIWSWKDLKQRFKLSFSKKGKVSTYTVV